MDAKRERAFEILGIAKDRKLILCLDGGGIRGILTLQLLKKLEALAEIPCYELFDMVSGTSTGGIIAGLITRKYRADEIEALYIKLVTKVFKKKGVFASRTTNPPKYSKANYRSALRDVVGNVSLEQVCTESGLDLLITGKDVAAGEETFFACFRHENKTHGTYAPVLLRAVMEATMSAPTYFTPLERFVDGGTTTYNNPTLSAIMEATQYGPKGKYDLNKLCVFSMGTGTTVEFVKPSEIENPKGIDAFFWLNFVMRESSQDASDMQNDLIRAGIIPTLDYRRFQISLDATAIRKLPNRSLSAIDPVAAEWLYDLDDQELKGIELDDVGKFGLMKIIGEAMVEYIMQHPEKGQFKHDLVNERGNDLLVTKFGDVARIRTQMSDPAWLDTFDD